MKYLATHHGIARRDGASEDACRLEEHDTWLIAAVADGVGASRAGGEAARRAVSMIVDYFHARPQAWSARRALGEFVQRINEVLHQESEMLHGQPEMLCTLSVVVIEGGVLHGVNVGDSPVYLQRKGRLRQLSQNQSLKEPGMEHVLTQAMGMARQLSPHFMEAPLEDGDVVLLCTDGVSKTLGEARLEELLARRSPARALVRSAEERWTEQPEFRDDATAVVIDLSQAGRTTHGLVRQLEIVPRLEAGDRHDGFVLEKPLNPGGRVWLARDGQGGPHVLKFAPPEAAEDEARRDAFMREIWHATRMEAPEFVHARVPGEGSLRYYILEYIEAPTLDSLLARGRQLPVEECVALARFLLSAAQYLLTRDHVHGDIKPENIMVIRGAEGTRFRMIDHGNTAALFSTNTRAGTPSYLAPERFEGSPLSERSEIYSIGATLYQALTGQLPFGEIERYQTPSFDRVPKAPSRRNAAVPAWLDQVVLRAIAVDVAARYSSFSEMAFDLDNPHAVEPFHSRGVALLVKNPLLFYKVLCLVLLVTVVVLSWKLAHYAH